MNEYETYSRYYDITFRVVASLQQEGADAEGLIWAAQSELDDVYRSRNAVAPHVQLQSTQNNPQREIFQLVLKSVLELQLSAPGLKWQLLTRIRPVGIEQTLDYLEVLHAALTNGEGPLPCSEVVGAAAYEAETVCQLLEFQDGDARKSDTLGAEVDLAVSLCLSWHLLLAWLWDIAVEKAEQEPADCVSVLQSWRLHCLGSSSFAVTFQAAAFLHLELRPDPQSPRPLFVQILSRFQQCTVATALLEADLPNARLLAALPPIPDGISRALRETIGRERVVAVATAAAPQLHAMKETGMIDSLLSHVAAQAIGVDSRWICGSSPHVAQTMGPGSGAVLTSTCLSQTRLPGADMSALKGAKCDAIQDRVGAELRGNTEATLIPAQYDALGQSNAYSSVVTENCRGQESSPFLEAVVHSNPLHSGVLNQPPKFPSDVTKYSLQAKILSKKTGPPSCLRYVFHPEILKNAEEPAAVALLKCVAVGWADRGVLPSLWYALVAVACNKEPVPPATDCLVGRPRAFSHSTGCQHGVDGAPVHSPALHNADNLQVLTRAACNSWSLECVDCYSSLAPHVAGRPWLATRDELQRVLPSSTTCDFKLPAHPICYSQLQAHGLEDPQLATRASGAIGSGLVIAREALALTLLCCSLGCSALVQNTHLDDPYDSQAAQLASDPCVWGRCTDEQMGAIRLDPQGDVGKLSTPYSNPAGPPIGCSNPSDYSARVSKHHGTVRQGSCPVAHLTGQVSCPQDRHITCGSFCSHRTTPAAVEVGPQLENVSQISCPNIVERCIGARGASAPQLHVCTQRVVADAVGELLERSGGIWGMSADGCLYVTSLAVALSLQGVWGPLSHVLTSLECSGYDPQRGGLQASRLGGVETRAGSKGMGLAEERKQRSQVAQPNWRASLTEKGVLGIRGDFATLHLPGHFAVDESMQGGVLGVPSTCAVQQQQAPQNDRWQHPQGRPDLEQESLPAQTRLGHGSHSTQAGHFGADRDAASPAPLNLEVLYSCMSETWASAALVEALQASGALNTTPQHQQFVSSLPELDHMQQQECQGTHLRCGAVQAGTGEGKQRVGVTHAGDLIVGVERVEKMHEGEQLVCGQHVSGQHVGGQHVGGYHVGGQRVGRQLVAGQHVGRQLTAAELVGGQCLGATMSLPSFCLLASLVQAAASVDVDLDEPTWQHVWCLLRQHVGQALRQGDHLWVLLAACGVVHNPAHEPLDNEQDSDGWDSEGDHWHVGLQNCSLRQGTRVQGSQIQRRAVEHPVLSATQKQTVHHKVQPILKTMSKSSHNPKEQQILDSTDQITQGQQRKQSRKRSDQDSLGILTAVGSARPGVDTLQKYGNGGRHICDGQQRNRRDQQAAIIVLDQDRQIENANERPRHKVARSVQDSKQPPRSRQLDSPGRGYETEQNCLENTSDVANNSLQTTPLPQGRSPALEFTTCKVQGAKMNLPGQEGFNILVLSSDSHPSVGGNPQRMDASISVDSSTETLGAESPQRHTPTLVSNQLLELILQQAVNRARQLQQWLQWATGAREAAQAKLDAESVLCRQTGTAKARVFCTQQMGTDVQVTQLENTVGWGTVAGSATQHSTELAAYQPNHNAAKQATQQETEPAPTNAPWKLQTCDEEAKRCAISTQCVRHMNARTTLCAVLPKGTTSSGQVPSPCEVAACLSSVARLASLHQIALANGAHQPMGRCAMQSAASSVLESLQSVLYLALGYIPQGGSVATAEKATGFAGGEQPVYHCQVEAVENQREIGAHRSRVEVAQPSIAAEGAVKQPVAYRKADHVQPSEGKHVEVDADPQPRGQLPKQVAAAAWSCVWEGLELLATLRANDRWCGLEPQNLSVGTERLRGSEQQEVLSPTGAQVYNAGELYGVRQGRDGEGAPLQNNLEVCADQELESSSDQCHLQVAWNLLLCLLPTASGNHVGSCPGEVKQRDRGFPNADTDDMANRQRKEGSHVDIRSRTRTSRAQASTQCPNSIIFVRGSDHASAKHKITAGAAAGCLTWAQPQPVALSLAATALSHRILRIAKWCSTHNSLTCRGHAAHVTVEGSKVCGKGMVAVTNHPAEGQNRQQESNQVRWQVTGGGLPASQAAPAGVKIPLFQSSGVENSQPWPGARACQEQWALGTAQPPCSIQNGAVHSTPTRVHAGCTCNLQHVCAHVREELQHMCNMLRLLLLYGADNLNSLELRKGDLISEDQFGSRAWLGGVLRHVGALRYTMYNWGQTQGSCQEGEHQEFVAGAATRGTRGTRRQSVVVGEQSEGSEVQNSDSSRWCVVLAVVQVDMVLATLLLHVLCALRGGDAQRALRKGSTEHAAHTGSLVPNVEGKNGAAHAPHAIDTDFDQLTNASHDPRTNGGLRQLQESHDGVYGELRGYGGEADVVAELFGIVYNEQYRLAGAKQLLQVVDGAYGSMKLKVDEDIALRRLSHSTYLSPQAMQKAAKCSPHLGAACCILHNILEATSDSQVLPNCLLHPSQPLLAPMRGQHVGWLGGNGAPENSQSGGWGDLAGLQLRLCIAAVEKGPQDSQPHESGHLRSLILDGLAYLVTLPTSSLNRLLPPSDLRYLYRFVESSLPTSGYLTTARSHISTLPQILLPYPLAQHPPTPHALPNTSTQSPIPSATSPKPPHPRFGAAHKLGAAHKATIAYPQSSQVDGASASYSCPACVATESLRSGSCVILGSTRVIHHLLGPLSSANVLRAVFKRMSDNSKNVTQTPTLTTTDINTTTNLQAVDHTAWPTHPGDATPRACLNSSNQVLPIPHPPAPPQQLLQHATVPAVATCGAHGFTHTSSEASMRDGAVQQGGILQSGELIQNPGMLQAGGIVQRSITFQGCPTGASLPCETALKKRGLGVPLRPARKVRRIQPTRMDVGEAAVERLSKRNLDDVQAGSGRAPQEVRPQLPGACAVSAPQPLQGGTAGCAAADVDPSAGVAPRGQSNNLATGIRLGNDQLGSYVAAEASIAPSTQPRGFATDVQSMGYGQCDRGAVLGTSRAAQLGMCVPRAGVSNTARGQLRTALQGAVDAAAPVDIVRLVAAVYNAMAAAVTAARCPAKNKLPSDAQGLVAGNAGNVDKVSPRAVRHAPAERNCPQCKHSSQGKRKSTVKELHQPPAQSSQHLAYGIQAVALTAQQKEGDSTAARASRRGKNSTAAVRMAQQEVLAEALDGRSAGINAGAPPTAGDIGTTYECTGLTETGINDDKVHTLADLKCARSHNSMNCLASGDHSSPHQSVMAQPPPQSIGQQPSLHVMAQHANPQFHPQAALHVCTDAKWRMTRSRLCLRSLTLIHVVARAALVTLYLLLDTLGTCEVLLTSAQAAAPRVVEARQLCPASKKKPKTPDSVATAADTCGPQPRRTLPPRASTGGGSASTPAAEKQPLTPSPVVADATHFNMYCATASAQLPPVPPKSYQETCARGELSELPGNQPHRSIHRGAARELSTCAQEFKHVRSLIPVIGVATEVVSRWAGVTKATQEAGWDPTWLWYGFVSEGTRADKRTLEYEGMLRGALEKVKKSTTHVNALCFGVMQRYADAFDVDCQGLSKLAGLSTCVPRREQARGIKNGGKCGRESVLVSPGCSKRKKIMGKSSGLPGSTIAGNRGSTVGKQSRTTCPKASQTKGVNKRRNSSRLRKSQLSGDGREGHADGQQRRKESDRRTEGCGASCDGTKELSARGRARGRKRGTQQQDVNNDDSGRGRSTCSSKATAAVRSGLQKMRTRQSREESAPPNVKSVFHGLSGAQQLPFHGFPGAQQLPRECGTGVAAASDSRHSIQSALPRVARQARGTTDHPAFGNQRTCEATSLVDEHVQVDKQHVELNVQMLGASDIAGSRSNSCGEAATHVGKEGGSCALGTCSLPSPPDVETPSVSMCMSTKTAEALVGLAEEVTKISHGLSTNWLQDKGARRDNGSCTQEDDEVCEVSLAELGRLTTLSLAQASDGSEDLDSYLAGFHGIPYHPSKLSYRHNRQPTNPHQVSKPHYTNPQANTVPTQQYHVAISHQTSHPQHTNVLADSLVVKGKLSIATRQTQSALQHPILSQPVLKPGMSKGMLVVEQLQAMRSGTKFTQNPPAIRQGKKDGKKRWHAKRLSNNTYILAALQHGDQNDSDAWSSGLDDFICADPDRDYAEIMAQGVKSGVTAIVEDNSE